MREGAARIRPLAGGLEGWQRLGFPLERHASAPPEIDPGAVKGSPRPAVR